MVKRSVEFDRRFRLSAIRKVKSAMTNFNEFLAIYKRTHIHMKDTVRELTADWHEDGL